VWAKVLNVVVAVGSPEGKLRRIAYQVTDGG